MSLGDGSDQSPRPVRSNADIDAALQRLRDDASAMAADAKRWVADQQRRPTRTVPPSAKVGTGDEAALPATPARPAVALGPLPVPPPAARAHPSIWSPPVPSGARSGLDVPVEPVRWATPLPPTGLFASSDTPAGPASISRPDRDVLP